MFQDFYKDKTVLVTGHTGFKGSWLCSWLLYMGANVVGYSKDIPTNPSLFELNQQKNNISHIQNDVRDLDIDNLNAQKIKENIIKAKKNEYLNMFSTNHLSKLKNNALIKIK